MTWTWPWHTPNIKPWRETVASQAARIRELERLLNLCHQERDNLDDQWAMATTRVSQLKGELDACRTAQSELSRELSRQAARVAELEPWTTVEPAFEPAEWNDLLQCLVLVPPGSHPNRAWYLEVCTIWQDVLGWYAGNGLSLQAESSVQCLEMDAPWPLGDSESARASKWQLAKHVVREVHSMPDLDERAYIVFGQGVGDIGLGQDLPGTAGFALLGDGVPTWLGWDFSDTELVASVRRYGCTHEIGHILGYDHQDATVMGPFQPEWVHEEFPRPEGESPDRRFLA